MSLFPSRGLDIHGLEIKTRRGDWLKELKTPEKAETIAAYCDYWWIVAGDESVAQKAEMPTNWGLLVSKDGALRQVKRAERLDPRALDRKFVAAILRRAEEWTRTQLESDARMTEVREKGRKEGLEEAKRIHGYNEEDLERLKKRLAEFEKRSGISIDNWHYGNVGDAVKAYLYSQRRDVVQELDQAAESMESAARQIREKARTLEASRNATSVAPAEASG
jgi:hypothetical protein